MTNKKIFLSLAHPGGLEVEYIQKAFLDNYITTLGPNIDGFEANIEKYLNYNSHVAAMNSGTSSIHLGLILLGVEPQDIVICQSMTFSASANPILYQGAVPVFIDSEKDTWNICPNALETAIIDCLKQGKKPKAIIAVHLYGTPYKVDEVRSIADKFDIPILEDSAEAMGSSYKNRKCGTFGDVGIISFNGNKIITTSAGGAIVLKNASLKQKAIFYATQAKDNASHFQHSEIGYNYRMSNVCAGIGLAQMKYLDEYVQIRRKTHDFYVDILKDINGVTVFSAPNKDYYSNYWLTTIVVDATKINGKTREDLRLYLETLNIESRPLWKPMHLQPVFAQYPFYGGTIAEQLFNKGLCLPSGSNMTPSDFDRIKLALTDFFK
jgi:dTDP-4-amino-4,6-dideoxygalactose transaminase